MLPIAGKLEAMATDQGATLDTAAVWNDFAARLRAFVAVRVSSSADVEDILQSVYLRIHQRLSSLRSDTRLEAWLYRITRNAVVDFYRGRQATVAIDDDESFAAAEEADPTRRDEIGRCLVPMLERLPPADREIIMLTDVGNASMSEAATQLGLSVPGAKSRAQRARARLRKMFVDCCRVELDATGRAIDLVPRRRGAKRAD